MKKILLIASVLASSMCFNACTNAFAEKTGINDSDLVYICMSSGATKYHATPKCNGLRNATHPIKEIEREKACDYGKCSPCKICKP